VISNKPQETGSYGYQKLIAWQKSNFLAEKVYEVTTSFPKSEVFGLTSQLRRAALSVPANIVEGYSRNSKKEFHHFLSISLGSLSEVEYFLHFSFNQKLINPIDFNELTALKEECGKIIWKLYQSQN
jgi:four helix bundle protein